MTPPKRRQSPRSAGAQESRGESRAILLAPHDEARTPRRFLPSKKPPFAIRWYGATSLYGHFRNFIARAIAAEQVDSRDWMRPAPPDVLLDRVSLVLRARQPGANLIERLGRPLWIDFVADTGDDRDTSEAVAAMLSARYRVKDVTGHTRVLPRGELLLFGGDTAYPVATADELHRRLTGPWNAVFRRRRKRDRRRRVLMGVPGNHDWYDGLDGFGRLFRRSATALPELGKVKKSKRARRRLLAELIGPKIKVQDQAGALGHKLHLDEVSGTLRIFGSVFRSMRAFLTGRAKRRRRRLLFLGYTAVQEASYFALPIAKGVDLWGVDRQLGRLDFRQRTYFRKLRRLHPERSLLLCASDPFVAYGERNAAGAQILEAVGLDTARDNILYVTGDFHHYERRQIGRVTQVIAGGGGAFLHGTRINQFSATGVEIPRAEMAYPSAKTSRRLLRSMPLKLAGGRAGYLVHFAGALVAWLDVAAQHWGTLAYGGITFGFAAAITALLYFIAGHGSAHPRSILAVALPFGLILGALPPACGYALDALFPGHSMGLAIVLAAFAMALVFGLFLATIAVLGLEHQQAFTVLGHTGFKHFVRMCVHPDGRIEGFVIGKDDPLAPNAPKLIDRFDGDYAADEPPPSTMYPPPNT